jgi:hypothetical protein
MNERYNMICNYFGSTSSSNSILIPISGTGKTLSSTNGDQFDYVGGDSDNRTSGMRGIEANGNKGQKANNIGVEGLTIITPLSKSASGWQMVGQLC